jgi:hypothetical protein
VSTKIRRAVKTPLDLLRQRIRASGTVPPEDDVLNGILVVMEGDSDAAFNLWQQNRNRNRAGTGRKHGRSVEPTKKKNVAAKARTAVRKPSTVHDDGKDDAEAEIDDDDDDEEEEEQEQEQEDEEEEEKDNGDNQEDYQDARPDVDRRGADADDDEVEDEAVEADRHDDHDNDDAVPQRQVKRKRGDRVGDKVRSKPRARTGKRSRPPKKAADARADATSGDVGRGVQRAPAVSPHRLAKDTSSTSSALRRHDVQSRGPTSPLERSPLRTTQAEVAALRLLSSVTSSSSMLARDLQSPAFQLPAHDRYARHAGSRQNSTFDDDAAMRSLAGKQKARGEQRSRAPAADPYDGVVSRVRQVAREAVECGHILLLPQAILASILRLIFTVHAIPLTSLSLVCRSFRSCLRAWAAPVAVSLRRLTADDVTGVLAYAATIEKNSAPRANGAAPPMHVHPLATLLRDLRAIELRDGVSTEHTGALLAALGRLKSSSHGIVGDPDDMSLATGKWRQPERFVPDARVTGRHVTPLTGLSLWRCNATDAPLIELGCVAGKRLVSLECVECPGLTGSVVHAWAELTPPPPLYLLRLDKCPKLLSKHFDNVSALETLRHVSLRNSLQMGGPVMIQELAKLPHIRSLGLSGAAETTDRSLQVLLEARLTTLLDVDLVGNVGVTYDGLYDLVRIHNLRRVNAMWVGPLTSLDVADITFEAEKRGVALRCVAEPSAAALDAKTIIDELDAEELSQ